MVLHATPDYLSPKDVVNITNFFSMNLTFTINISHEQIIPHIALEHQVKFQNFLQNKFVFMRQLEDQIEMRSDGVWD